MLAVHRGEEGRFTAPVDKNTQTNWQFRAISLAFKHEHHLEINTHEIHKAIKEIASEIAQLRWQS